MTDDLTILADMRRALVLLAELNDPAATRTAAALTSWLAGDSFDSAAGLAPGWRSHQRVAARDRALRALSEMHPEIDVTNLARRIARGLAREAARRREVRPDGEAGHLHDLVRTDACLSERHLRRILTEIRRGQAELEMATST
ncbi:MAG: hypothetical protein WB823_10950 [Steroidobacteraceae bacterium]